MIDIEMQPHSSKLFPDSDLIVCIREFFFNNLYGYVSDVVGNLSKACIQCPSFQKINKFEGDLERISRMAILIMVMSLFNYVLLMMDVMFLEDI